MNDWMGDSAKIVDKKVGDGDTSSELNAISRFKAMEGLEPQVKRKILSDNPRQFYGVEDSKTVKKTSAALRLELLKRLEPFEQSFL